jgi:hypothetical protein
MKLGRSMLKEANEDDRKWKEEIEPCWICRRLRNGDDGPHWCWWCGEWHCPECKCTPCVVCDRPHDGETRFGDCEVCDFYHCQYCDCPDPAWVEKKWEWQKRTRKK